GFGVAPHRGVVDAGEVGGEVHGPGHGAASAVAYRLAGRVQPNRSRNVPERGVSGNRSRARNSGTTPLPMSSRSWGMPPGLMRTPSRPATDHSSITSASCEGVPTK